MEWTYVLQVTRRRSTTIVDVAKYVQQVFEIEISAQILRCQVDFVEVV